MWKCIKFNKKEYNVFITFADKYIDIYYTDEHIQKVHCKYLKDVRNKKILSYDKERKVSRIGV